MRHPAQRAFTIVAVLFALIFSQVWISVYACTTTAFPVASDLTVSATSADSHSDLRDHRTGVACHAHCDNSAQPDHAEQPAPSPPVWLPMIWGHSAIFALTDQLHLPARAEPIEQPLGQASARVDRAPQPDTTPPHVLARPPGAARPRRTHRASDPGAGPPRAH